MHRHHALTQEPMTPEALAAWIKNNAKDHYPHTIREFFTEDEKVAMQKRSTDYTDQIIMLNDSKKLIDEAFTKGNVNEYEATIPETMGIKKLTETRDKLVRELRKGYSEHTVEIYEIPNEDGVMYYFTAAGEIIEERTRNLSQREIKEYFGELFMSNKLRSASN